MSTLQQASLYSLGSVHPNTKGHATFDTKPQSFEGEVRNSDGDLRIRHDTGGGYERFRSYEFRPHTPKQGKESVYASHHRLLAIVECYPMDMEIGDVLDHLQGKDVHHTTGVEWCNFGESPNFDDEERSPTGGKAGIQVREHDSHSSITQAEMRAYAEDDKKRAKARSTLAEENRCSSCDDESDVLCRVESFDEGTVCLECSKRLADGPIEVLQ